MALLSSCRGQLCWCGSICSRTPEYGSPTMIRAFGRVPWTAELLKGFTVAGRSRLACPSLSPLYHLLCSTYGQTGFFPYCCAWRAPGFADRLVFWCFNKVEELGVSTRIGRHLGPKMCWVRRRKETGLLKCPSKPPFYDVGLTGSFCERIFLAPPVCLPKGG